MIDKILQELANVSLELVDEEFNNSVDPFWNPWKPLKKQDHKILIKTGNLKASTESSVTGTGIILKNTAPYASYHNFGTRKIPQRQILPIDVLPDKWKEKFIEAIKKAMKKDIE